MSIAAGTKLSHYEIRSKIGEGGMGEVYLAHDLNLDRRVALKILPFDFAVNQDRMRRFTQEAKAAAALNHPNIAHIYEIGESEGINFIAMEFVDGQTLRRWMDGTPMTLAEKLDVSIQIANALTAAHAAGIVHRDIKPDNVMLRQDFIVKVLDFGLAKLTQPTNSANDSQVPTRALVQTEPGRVMGTVAYMSPEQLRGLEIDARSDIWSLGAVLYEMVAGRTPFAGETSSHIGFSILESEPAPLSRYAPEAPAELQRLVRKALTKDRDSRYQSVRDLMIDLKSLHRDLDIQSEMQRSSAPGMSGADSVANQQIAAKDSEGASSVPATSFAEARPTRSDGRTPDGSIRYRIGALVAMLLLAAGALGFWYYFQRQKVGAPINSIAVMPFVNESGSNDLEYLSEGLTESLITRLSQLPKLSVKARNSVFRYKGKDVSPEQVGKELNVQAIVNGRVVQRGQELTLHIELVDVNTETALWSGDYNRPMTDFASLQSEIARDVSNKLQLKLSGADQQKLAKNYTANTQAYELYLQGRFHWNKRTSEAIKQAIVYFNRAIEIDPSYALAYTGLADCYNLQGLREIAPDEAFPKGKAAALRALEIDDSLAEAHNSLGFVKHRYEWDWQGAEKEFRRALELNPNYSTAHQWYAFYFASLGRHAESIAEMKRALELDPLSLEINADVGVMYSYARQPDLAIEALKKTVALEENFAYSHYMLSRPYVMRGMYAEAIKEAQKASDLGGRSPRLIGNLAMVQAVAGRQAEAQKTLGELSNRSTQSYVSALELALIHTGLVEKEKAIAELQRAYGEHSTGMAFLTVDFRFDSLRSDPRFAELVRRVGPPQ